MKSNREGGEGEGGEEEGEAGGEGEEGGQGEEEKEKKAEMITRQLQFTSVTDTKNIGNLEKKFNYRS